MTNKIQKALEELKEVIDHPVGFDDLKGIPDGVCNILAERGVVWVTEFKWGEKLMTGHVVASSEAAATAIANQRGLGEEVVGKLEEIGTL